MVMSMSRGRALIGRAEKPRWLILEAHLWKMMAASRVADDVGSVAVVAQRALAEIGRGPSCPPRMCSPARDTRGLR